MWHVACPHLPMKDVFGVYFIYIKKTIRFMCVLLLLLINPNYSDFSSSLYPSFSVSLNASISQAIDSFHNPLRSNLNRSLTPKGKSSLSPPVSLTPWLTPPPQIPPRLLPLRSDLDSALSGSNDWSPADGVRLWVWALPVWRLTLMIWCRVVVWRRMPWLSVFRLSRSSRRQRLKVSSNFL